MIMRLTEFCRFEWVVKASKQSFACGKNNKICRPNKHTEEASGTGGGGSHCWQLAIGVSSICGSQKGRRNVVFVAVKRAEETTITLLCKTQTGCLLSFFHDGKSAETCLQALTSTESNSFSAHTTYDFFNPMITDFFFFQFKKKCCSILHLDAYNF